MLAPSSAVAQSAVANAGIVVTGTVREAGGAAIAGATVRALGADRRTLTDGNGRYELSLPLPWRSYELQVERLGYFRFATTLSIGASGSRITRDVRLNPSNIALRPLEVSSTRPAQRAPQGPTPGGNEEAWQPAFTDPYAIVPGDLAAIATQRPGVVALGRQDDDAMPRLSISGRHPSQNRVLVDGAAFGASTLPPEALRSTSIISNTYDPARGQFSGGQIAATTRSGSNLFGGALRLRVEPSMLQAGSLGGAGDNRYTVAEVGGGAGGALLPGRLFWFAAANASRNSTARASLASLPAGTLPELGLSADSIHRFRDVTSTLGFASAWNRPPSNALLRRASGLVRLDFHATQAHTLTLRLDARGAEMTGLGASAFGITGADERSSRTSGGVLGQVASYLGSIRNELRLYRSVDDRRRRGGPSLPGGSVDVLSDLGEGRSGLSRLSFGEAVLASNARSTLTELSDELLLRLAGDDHRLKLGFTLSREDTRQAGTPNGNGTFTFRSLADLEAGRPFSFTRTLGGETRGAAADYAALFAAHQWHATPRLWVIQGLRVERTRWPGAPAAADALRSGLGLADGRTGSRLEVSPRVGFVYETPDKRWDLRGGVGRFVGTLPLAALAEAFGEAGTGETRLVCLGVAAPAPEWARYAADPGAIPTRCADGDGAENAARAATVFAPGFSPPRTWRASAGGGGALLRGRRGRLDLHLDATLVLGSGEPIATDRNLAAAPRFVLAGEGSRPVFAPAERIDAATGAIDQALSRVLPAYGVVREAAASGRSAVGQVTAGISFLGRRFDVLAASYTHTRATDEVSGFRGPGGFSMPVAAGDPNLRLRGPSDAQRRHSLQLQAVHPFGRWVEMGIIAHVVSGMPFTPLVDADVNGDGLANDAAFIFNAQADAQLARAMDDLRRNAPASVRGCLSRQANRIAARNSCSGPWRTSVDLQVNFPVDRGTRASRLTASVAVNNVTAGLDRLLHGENGLRGWGNDGYVDPTLLRVQGFDAQRQAFVYAVNSSFGDGRRDPLRLPATLTLSARVAVGSDPARQPMAAMTAGIRARGRTAAELGGEIAARIPNTPRQVLNLCDTLKLELSPEQHDTLQKQAAALGERLAPLTELLAAQLSIVERGGDDARRAEARAATRQLVGEMQAGIDEINQKLKDVLTPAQWARLPEDVRRPARQLVPPRTLSAGAGDTW